MNKKIVLLAYTSILLLSCVGVSFQFIKSVRAVTTWTVDDDGPADFSSIQAAINAASEGDTINVKAGIYYENVLAEKTITLIGEDRDATIINGNGVGIVVEVTANNVVIANLTVTNSGKVWGYDRGDAGMYLNHANNTVVRNCNIANNLLGILLDASSSNSMFRNDITHNSDGIWTLYSSNHNTIFGNNVTANTLTGIRLLFSPSYNSIFENNITGHTYHGIFLSSSSNNTIFRNHMANNDWRCVYIRNSSNNTVSENNITTSNNEGILVEESSDSNIYGNNIEGTGYGIRFYHASYNSITRNNIIDNYQGIFFSASSYNSISGNNIKENYYGVHLYYESPDNVVYHNNFVDNTNQVYIRPQYPSIITWDDGYPSGGNYWSDYAGVDGYNGPDQDILGSGGIGDTSYVIDANNQDNYPLMGPFTDFTVPCQAENYHVTTICNSTISDFNYTPKTISFNVTGQGESVGFCRIMIPRVLLGEEPYEVLVDGNPISYRILQCSNSTHVFLYFTYTHSNHKILITGAPTMPVGGYWVPINKFELLAPWIGLASLLTVVVVSVVYVKYRKKQQT